MSKRKMTRHGKPLGNVPKGDRRRLSDFRNAWRKMSPEQRREALDWLQAEHLPVAPKGGRP